MIKFRGNETIIVLCRSLPYTSTDVWEYVCVHKSRYPYAQHAFEYIYLSASSSPNKHCSLSLGWLLLIVCLMRNRTSLVECSPRIKPAVQLAAQHKHARTQLYLVIGVMPIPTPSPPSTYDAMCGWCEKPAWRVVDVPNILYTTTCTRASEP